MKILVGWRLKENEHIAHYYCTNDSYSGGDVTSLCGRINAFRKDLVFPAPGLGQDYCEVCQNENLIS